MTPILQPKEEDRMTEITMDSFWKKCFESLARPGASELVANGPDSFFVTYRGRKERIDAPRMSVAKYTELIQENLVPLVDSELEFNPDGGYLFEGHYTVPEGFGNFEGRCHIALKPISEVPLVTLTKIAESTNTIESIAASGSMSTEMMQFLIAAVRAKLTIVLSGQSGAGKTTTLQALTKYFDDQDRVAVGEDLPEIKLSQPNAFYLHTLPWRPGLDANRVADLSFVVKQFLRQRPDRVIIGETRGREFADFLVAANSGMKGSMTTLHAEDPSGALDKMTRFALQGSDKQPIRSINKEIGTAIDIVVQLARIQGRHRITHIQEVTATVSNSEDAKLTTQTLYEYKAAVDQWEKPNMMGDKLKETLIEAGEDIKAFQSTPRGTMLKAHKPPTQSAPFLEPNSGGTFRGGGLPFGGSGGRQL